MDVRIDYVAVAKLVDEGGAVLVAEATAKVRGRATRLVPVDTGELRASIDSYVTPFRGVVSVGTSYWAAQEYGARPHTIRPRVKRALTWDGAEDYTGGPFFGKVDHPGNAPQPFMRPALDVTI